MDQLVWLANAMDIQPQPPLIRATLDGNIHLVRNLLKQPHIEIEQTATVTVHGNQIDGATALCCATVRRHFNIVRLLIAHGADVNTTTYDNWTPLFIACTNDDLEMVQQLTEAGADTDIATNIGDTCLMIACLSGNLDIVRHLLAVGANINLRNHQGRTALHMCAQSGAMCCLRVLLRAHSRPIVGNDVVVMPLVLARLADNTGMIRYLNRLPYVQRADRIAVLELHGCYAVDVHDDYWQAEQLWLQALEMRNELPLLEKRLDVVVPPQKAYIRAVEWRNETELTAAVQCPDAMNMQALLMRERILGPDNWQTVEYIHMRAKMYAAINRFDRCRDLMMYGLLMAQRHWKPLAVFRLLFDMFEVFRKMRDQRLGRVRFYDMLRLLLFTVGELRRGVTEKPPNAVLLDQTLILALHMACLCMSGEEKPQYTSASKFEGKFIEAIEKMVQANVIGKMNRTALHVACHPNMACVDKRGHPYKLVRLLLQVGADPNARDTRGSTPLHHLGMRRPCPPKLAQILVDGGAHLDTTNNAGETFESLLRHQKLGDLVKQPLQHMRLSCLAARVVRKHRLDYRGLVPVHLYDVIEKH